MRFASGIAWSGQGLTGVGAVECLEDSTVAERAHPCRPHGRACFSVQGLYILYIFICIYICICIYIYLCMYMRTLPLNNSRYRFRAIMEQL